MAAKAPVDEAAGRPGRCHVFVSYRRRSSSFAALALTYAVRLAGHDAFLDVGSISDGDAYRDVIRDALARSDLVLALIAHDLDPARLHEPLDPVAFEWRRARFHGCAVHPVLLAGAAMPAESDLPPDLRWITRSSATALGGPDLDQQVEALVAAVPHLAVPPRRVARILWVDDNPANNEYERSVLRQKGIVFDNVVSSGEAVEQLLLTTYDLVITDLGRRWSSDASGSAGRDLLSHPVIARGGPPVIVYAGPSAVKHRGELEQLGAFGVSDDREHLFELVFQALGREHPPPRS